jgi:cytoskeletal protein RodZ
MTSDVGSRLRQAREQRGLALRDIANTTKISMTALIAIERNDFARLPGGVFRRAYVAAFASAVGLNAEDVTRDYRARFEPEVSAAQHLLHGAEGADRSRARRRLATALAAGAGLLIGGWLMLKPVQPSQAVPGEAWPANAVQISAPEHPAPAGESDGSL